MSFLLQVLRYIDGGRLASKNAILLFFHKTAIAYDGGTHISRWKAFFHQKCYFKSCVSRGSPITIWIPQLLVQWLPFTNFYNIIIHRIRYFAPSLKQYGQDLKYHSITYYFWFFWVNIKWSAILLPHFCSSPSSPQSDPSCLFVRHKVLKLH